LQKECVPRFENIGNLKISAIYENVGNFCIAAIFIRAIAFFSTDVL